MLDRVSLEAAMTFCSIRLSSAVTSVAITATATLIAGCSAPNDIATLLVDSLLSEHGISSSRVHFKPGVRFLPRARA
jgi:hypothetical protein